MVMVMVVMVVMGTYVVVGEGVEVGTAHAAVGDGDVNVCFFPFFGFELRPSHFAIDRIWVMAEPALPFGVGHAGPEA